MSGEGCDRKVPSGCTELNALEQGTAKNESGNRKSRKFQMIVLFKEVSLSTAADFGI